MKIREGSFGGGFRGLNLALIIIAGLTTALVIPALQPFLVVHPNIENGLATIGAVASSFSDPMGWSGPESTSNDVELALVIIGTTFFSFLLVPLRSRLCTVLKHLGIEIIEDGRPSDVSSQGKREVWQLTRWLFIGAGVTGLGVVMAMSAAGATKFASWHLQLDRIGMVLLALCLTFFMSAVGAAILRK